MNFCKVIHTQDKYMKATWLYYQGGGGVSIKFAGAKNISANGKDINI